MKNIKRKNIESQENSIEELSLDDFRLVQVSGAGVNSERNTEHNNSERNTEHNNSERNGSGNGGSLIAPSIL